MANEFYTLIVVPHARARFRKFQVSVRLTRWVLAAFGVMALVLVGILVHYTWIAVEVAEIRRLRVENLALATKARAYEENAGQLQAKVLQLQSVVTKLGIMAGVEQSLPDASIGGVGGLSRSETTPPSVDIASTLQSLDQTVGGLSEKSTRLEAYFKDQRAVLASTPSTWPLRGYLSAGFGNRLDPFTGLRDFHPGLDISVPRGSKVRAPADGVVVFCGIKNGYGNTIVLDHGLRNRHPLRPPGRLQRAARPAREAGRRHRLQRKHRPLDRTPPALRGVGERPDAQPASSTSSTSTAASDKAGGCCGAPP